MARKTQSQALETKQRILTAALDVFCEKGFSGSSLDDIAAAAGLSRGAIYHHYESKRDRHNLLLFHRGADIVFPETPRNTQRVRYCQGSCLVLAKFKSLKVS